MSRINAHKYIKKRLDANLLRDNIVSSVKELTLRVNDLIYELDFSKIALRNCEDRVKQAINFAKKRNKEKEKHLKDWKRAEKRLYKFNNDSKYLDKVLDKSSYLGADDAFDRILNYTKYIDNAFDFGVIKDVKLWKKSYKLEWKLLNGE